ncbi:efflux RND transporter periplasmic adaptor subunit [Actinosynnema sp. NPDC023587]|uniref:efflux RND transporter periplasmic adaptor subunit n=1 Tax=Actinosynnema sp. NPDC023587 TaxID=3154695 RepID=UPI0033CE7CC2
MGLGRVLGAAVVLLAAQGCTSGGGEVANPDLAPRGTTMTTAKPTRQDLGNKVGLTGAVTMNPIFGLVAPVGGQIRYFDVAEAESTPTTPTRVANVWADGTPNQVVVPAGSTFGGRLVDDRSTVTAGMPIASAKYAGYGIVADINGEQAYQIADSVTGAVRAQIKNGPGPFDCSLLGTIAALPAGTVPPPPPPQREEPDQDVERTPGRGAPQTPEQPRDTSGPTGLRLVCTAPDDVKLINGATATLEVVTATAPNALVVPVEAVAGGQGKGKVDVLAADGSRQTKDVVLGLTDGKVVEIKEGLTGEETLAVPGPDLPRGPENAGRPEGGSR